MAASFKIRIRPNKKANGMQSLFLQLIIHRRKRNIPIDIEVNGAYWSDKTQELKADPDKKLLINQIKARANDILIKDRLSNAHTTLDSFEYRFHNYENLQLFCFFLKHEIEKRFVRMDIENNTYRQHLSIHKKIKLFDKDLTFSDITPDWLDEFDKWHYQYLLKNLSDGKTLVNDGINTRWAAMKCIRTYLNIALKKGITNVYPFKSYSIKKVQGDFKFLTEDQLKKMYLLYKSNQLPSGHQETCRAFLIACGTGLRISDAERIDVDKSLKSGELNFIPHKTRKTYKRTRIHLNELTKELLNECNGKILNHVSAITNRHLKRISTELDLPFKLSFHSGRHTFATLFLKQGGNIEVLQKILNHSDISTTMIYVHVIGDRVKSQINLIDQAIK